MAAAKSWKLRVGFLLILCIVGVIYFGYFYCGGGSICPFRKGSSFPAFKSNFDAYFAGRFLQNKFSQNELNKDYDIDLDNQDVIVFLHIQKTGGTTFGKHLVENLEVHPPCNCYKRVKKHCDCLNKRKQVWLFSRYSTGWRCGLHADWTELTNCVDVWFQQTYGNEVHRQYYYITMIRDPVPRFISEWMHVRRGATWKTASLKCNGREATLEEVPFCYQGENWMDVTVKQFMDCRHNLAFNRQTRMLANLTAVNCYDTNAMSPARRNALLLDSAKRNLKQMAFFGLVEFQAFSQFLFEHSLHMNFLHDFVQHNRTHSSQGNLTSDDLKRIAELNHLDIELYQFAKDLFLQRVQKAYTDEGQPVPEMLERLLAQKAVEQPKETTEGGYSVLPEYQGLHSDKEDVRYVAEKDRDLSDSSVTLGNTAHTGKQSDWLRKGLRASAGKSVVNAQKAGMNGKSERRLSRSRHLLKPARSSDGVRRRHSRSRTS